MNRFLVINSRKVSKLFLYGFFILAAGIWFSFQAKVIPAYQAAEETKYREIHMVTGEFSTKTDDGAEMEVYRFDPGTIYLKKGEKVHLKILGVNGDAHNFTIEGTDIQGTINKGKETVIPLQFEKKGTYRLICITHQDQSNGGPMIAYIVVD